MATGHLKNDRYFPLFRLCCSIFQFSLDEIFFKHSYLVKIIWTNILQGKKYGVVQTVSPLSRDFLFLAIKPTCSDVSIARKSKINSGFSRVSFGECL